MSLLLERVQQILAETKNFVFPEEMFTLGEYAAQVNDPLVTVGLGSYCGASDAVMALASHVDHYAVDWHQMGEGDNYPFNGLDNHQFMETMIRYGVAQKVHVVNWDTKAFGQIFDKQIGLLFVDASHSYEAVRADLDAWLPHVVPHGIVAFHDYTAEQIAWLADQSPDLAFVQSVVMTGFFSYQPEEPKPPIEKPFSADGIPDAYLDELPESDPIEVTAANEEIPPILIELAPEPKPKVTRKPAAKTTAKKGGKKA